MSQEEIKGRNEMKISELIQKLEELKASHGDVEVFTWNDIDCSGYGDWVSPEPTKEELFHPDSGCKVQAVCI